MGLWLIAMLVVRGAHRVTGVGWHGLVGRSGDGCWLAWPGWPAEGRLGWGCACIRVLVDRLSCLADIPRRSNRHANIVAAMLCPLRRSESVGLADSLCWLCRRESEILRYNHAQHPRPVLFRVITFPQDAGFGSLASISPVFSSPKSVISRIVGRKADDAISLEQVGLFTPTVECLTQPANGFGNDMLATLPEEILQQIVQYTPPTDLLSLRLALLQDTVALPRAETLEGLLAAISTGRRHFSCGSVSRRDWRPEVYFWAAVLRQG
ncbi:hypothetical protein BT67DRAFT_37799 [Trichocladium antarcticum]|uniref:F-box domain-containing protein n=1 Tax=Trichocladium antarcticum TaxID=1450529 RepID=A0AAN6UIG8_9PEZI|nr:hypothetical protein BT67DRAFT_37799 [Trichocladium antarcticum]